jgi:CRP-like cAMP-binding protein
MEIIIRKLELRSTLSADEKDALHATFGVVRMFEPGQDLLSQGERPAFVGALLDGLLCRYKALPAGERQIVSFPLPGDIFDLHSFLLDRMDHSVGALARSRVAVASHAALQALAEAYPRLAALLWRDAVIEGAIFREWIVNCGRRTGYARTAHLLCELFVRMADVGLTREGGYGFPVTQVDISDAVGLSPVHVNRVLQQLRAEGLISLRGGRLTIHDWDGLVKAAGFTPDYLNVAENQSAPDGFAFVLGTKQTNAQARFATGDARDGHG